MKQSLNTLPDDLRKMALTAAKAHNAAKTFVTSDGHVYLPENEHDLLLHCRTFQRTYWEVEADSVPAPKAKVVFGGKAAIKTAAEGAKAEPISDDDLSKMKEAAGATGDDEAFLASFKGVSIDQLAKKGKPDLQDAATKLGIAFAPDDTKAVLAEAIYKTAN